MKRQVYQTKYLVSTWANILNLPYFPYFRAILAILRTKIHKKNQKSAYLYIIGEGGNQVFGQNIYTFTIGHQTKDNTYQSTIEG